MLDADDKTMLEEAEKQFGLVAHPNDSIEKRLISVVFNLTIVAKQLLDPMARK